MISATELQAGPIRVMDFRCSAGPAEKPFVEQHQAYSVSYVRKGSFGYRVRGKSYGGRLRKRKIKHAKA